MSFNSQFAVIFDMDGVIIHSNPFHKKALIQFCEQHGYHLSEEQLREKIYGRTNKDWITNLFGELPMERIQQYAEEKESLFRKIFRKDIVELNGYSRFLKSLEENGISRAIATSAPRKNVDFTLDAINVSETAFNAILDDSFVNKGKPDPEIYLKTAEAIQFSPENCVVFEDSVSGVKSALAAGMKVIGVLTTHTTEELEGTAFCINDFTEIDISAVRSLFE